MGIHVQLAVIPERIAQRAWEQAYDETVKLLRSWPDPPLGIQYREISGQRLIVYTRAFEHDRGWCVVGDARTRRRAESFDFPRELRGAGGAPGGGGDGALDVLVAVARNADFATIFGEKTQGEPYHHLLVAVGLLIENRFPRAALVHGEIDRADGERARDALASLFGTPFELPVIVDEPRARARLVGRVDDSDLEQLLSRYRATPSENIVADLLAIMERGSARTRLIKDLERNAPSCTDARARALREETRFALKELGGKLAELARGLELPQRAAAGELDRDRLVAEIAAGVALSSRALTEMAWEDISAAGGAELRLLWVLAHVQNRELVLSLMVRALFESPAVRRFALSSLNPVDRAAFE